MTTPHAEFTSAGVSQSFIAEARRLLGEDYLPKIERCLEKLTDEQVWWRPKQYCSLTKGAHKDNVLLNEIAFFMVVLLRVVRNAYASSVALVISREAAARSGMPSLRKA